jgi:hypothetical protein
MTTVPLQVRKRLLQGPPPLPAKDTTGEPMPATVSTRLA